MTDIFDRAIERTKGTAVAEPEDVFDRGIARTAVEEPATDPSLGRAEFFGPDIQEAGGPVGADVRTGVAVAELVPRTKGPGFLGTLQRPDGGVSTELSIGVEFDGKETEIPSLIPTLSPQEIDHMLSGAKPTRAIVAKAVAHARQRAAQGLGPFATQADQRSPRVISTEAIVERGEVVTPVAPPAVAEEPDLGFTAEEQGNRTFLESVDRSLNPLAQIKDFINVIGKSLKVGEFEVAPQQPVPFPLQFQPHPDLLESVDKKGLVELPHAAARSSIRIAGTIGRTYADLFPWTGPSKVGPWAERVIAEHPDWTATQVNGFAGLVQNPIALAGRIVEVIPQVAFIVGASAVGTVLGGPGGGKVALFMAAAVLEGDELAQEAIKAGRLDREVASVRIIGGGVSAILEVLQIGTAKRFGQVLRGAIKKKSLSIATAKVAAGTLPRLAAIEGVQEALQGIVQETTALAIWGKPIDDGFVDRRMQEFLIGATAYPLIGGATGIAQQALIERMNERSDRKAAELAEQERVGDILDQAIAAEAQEAVSEAVEGIPAPEAAQPEIVAPEAPATPLEGVTEVTEGVSDAIQERQAEAVPVQEEAPSGEEVSQAPTEVQEEIEEVLDVTPPTEPQIQAPEVQAEVQPQVAPEVEGPVTGLANAIVEAEQAAREGRPPRKGPRTTAQGVIDNAKKDAEADPQLGPNLVKSFQRNMRPASVEDIGILLHERTRLTVAENDAANAAQLAILSGEPQAIREATDLLEQLQAELQIISDVSTMTGTEQGQAFWARKLLVKMDFSLAGMLRTRFIANEGPLSVKQRAQIIRLQKRNAELEQQIADRIEEVDKLQRDVASKQAVTELKKPRPRAKGKWGSKNRLVSIARADKARKLLNSKLTQLNVGLDPEMVKAAAELALFNVEAGVTTLAEFTSRMFSGLSKKARTALQPHLDDLWKNAQSQFAEGERERAVTRITDSIERGAELTQLAPAVKDLARSFVIDGIDDLDALVDAVHAVLLTIDPNITRKEANELLAGYGRFRQLDKSETEVELRRLRREALETAKLTDALEGKFPKKTGGEQQAPSDLARLVQKKTQEAIKEQGLEPTDPETQLKSFRASKKTRLANEISALEDQLAVRERLARGQRAEISDPEITALTRQRDLLKEQFDAMFAAGIEQETQAKRRRTTERALEKQLKELEKRRDTGDLFPDRPTRVKLRGKKLDALRAKVEAVKAELDELKSLDPRSEVEADARALKSYKTRTTNRIADLKRRIAEGDFETKPTRKVKLDKEATRLQFERSQVLAEYQKALWDDKRKRRKNITKVVQFTGEVLNVSRAFISSYDFSAVFRQGIVGTVSHPLRTIPAVVEMFKALSKQSAFEAEQKIRARELFPLAQQAGVEFTEHGTDLAKFEEAYQSRWAERIPGVAASERVFVTFLNRQRMDMFEYMTKWLTKTGEPTMIEARAIAAYVNIATGKADIRSAKAKTVLATLSAVLWSPKLQISRFQFLTLQAMYGGSNRTRTLIALEYARFLGGLAVLYATWVMAGGDLEEDPRSSDFLKLKVKNTRIDPLGGFSQMIVFASRIISGSKKSLNGKVVPIRGEVPYGSDNTWDIITRFARSKLSPGVGAGVNIATGTNVIGEEVTPITISRDLGVPMAVRDIFESMKDLGFPIGMIPGALAIFGVGVQAFETKKPKPKKPAKRKKRKTRG